MLYCVLYYLHLYLRDRKRTTVGGVTGGKKAGRMEEMRAGRQEEQR